MWTFSGYLDISTVVQTENTIILEVDHLLGVN